MPKAIVVVGRLGVQTKADLAPKPMFLHGILCRPLSLSLSVSL